MPAQSQEVSETTDTSLCIGCGLCCDGTFLTKVIIDPVEEERLTSVGLSINSDNEQQWFALPCGAFGDGRCTVYEARPGICRTFRCKLLKAYEAGEVSFESAIEKIRIAKDLRLKVTEDEPAAAQHKYRLMLQRELRASKARPQLLLKITALEYFLDQWFRKKKDSPNDNSAEADEASQA